MGGEERRVSGGAGKESGRKAGSAWPFSGPERSDRALRLKFVLEAEGKGGLGSGSGGGGENGDTYSRRSCLQV